MKKILLTLVVLSSLSLSVLPASDLSFEGYVRNYIGVRTTEDLDYSVVDNTFNLKMEYGTGNALLFVNTYLNYDRENTLEADLREIYVDIYFDRMDFRVGLQQVIWGKSDGVFITDVVSPKDLSEFLLPDFEEIRMGIKGIKADYYFDNSSLEFIWVPTFTPNTIADADSIWNLSGKDFSSSSDSIDYSLENSEGFARYSLFTSFIDFEFMGAYMWDDEPTIVSFAPWELDHNRLLMGGGSFSSVLGDFIVRGEGAFYSGKYFLTDSYSNLEKNYVHYLAGVDYGLSGWNLSTQFIQKIILEYDDAISQDQIQNTMTFLINKKFIRDTLLLELFTYMELNDIDSLNALVRPKISYDISDGLNILVGANVFLGDEGTFGQYSENSMVYSKVKYSF